MSVDFDIERGMSLLDQRAKRARAVSAIATLVPMLVAIGALVFLLMQIVEANEDLHAIRAETARLNAETARLNETKEQLRREIADLRGQRDRLAQQTLRYEQDRAEVRKRLERITEAQAPAVRQTLAEAIPISAVAAPKASATPLLDEPNTYVFRLWLEVPEQRRGEIAKVTYRLDHPTFAVKDRSSTNAANNFAVEYRGWGALTNVVITIRLQDGSTQQMPFNMYAAIDWPKADTSAKPKAAY